jgi:hypothetical protein
MTAVFVEPERHGRVAVLTVNSSPVTGQAILAHQARSGAPAPGEPDTPQPAGLPNRAPLPGADSAESPSGPQPVKR